MANNLDPFIERLNRKLAGTEMILNTSLQMGTNYIKSNASWTDRTGQAKAGIIGELSGGGTRWSLMWFHSVFYGKWLENGTPPHVITPVNAKALYWSGAAHPVKKVNHPGTKGGKDFEKAKDYIANEVTEAINEWWSDL